MADHLLIRSDARRIPLRDASVDAVITDPPYACVDRPYGYWTEEEWFALMKPVVRECRRVLKPHGSAVFILQPNSERVGRMRPWLWDFLSWCCREWNVVQDGYWWNVSTMPTVHTHQTNGLMRPSLKMAVWLGDPDCRRYQDDVLWDQGRIHKASSLADRALHSSPSGHSVRHARAYGTAIKRGGATPFNVLPWGANGGGDQGNNGHGATTPEYVCAWWIRYLTRPGDTVLDPFSGTGTTGRAARRLRRTFIGIERVAEYHAIAARLLAEPPRPLLDAALLDMEPRQVCLF